MSNNVETEEIIGGCAVAIFIAVLMIFFGAYLVFASGVVLSTFWAWFIAPVFPGLPAVLGIKQAIGISMFFGALNSSHLKAIVKMAERNKAEERSTIQGALLIAGIILGPWLALLIGSLFHSFFM